MNEHQSRNENVGVPDEEPQGPSLKLLYGFVALALAAAIAIATLIVLPFYQRR